VTDRTKDNLLLWRDVHERCKLGRTTVYRRMEAGTFPHNFLISANVSAWYESDIDAWVADPMGWRNPASKAA
jgi:prophage regulatory protein